MRGSLSEARTQQKESEYPMSKSPSTAPAQILVTVETQYLPEQSSIDEGRYAFSYHIVIKHQGGVPAQLISRHWVITDGEGSTDEVKGLGVVGYQPLLQPGQLFDYTSGCILATPVGSMRGTYHMVTEQGEPFAVTIPEFTLAMPRVLH